MSVVHHIGSGGVERPHRWLPPCHVHAILEQSSQLLTLGQHLIWMLQSHSTKQQFDGDRTPLQGGECLHDHLTPLVLTSLSIEMSLSLGLKLGWQLHDIVVDEGWKRIGSNVVLSSNLRWLHALLIEQVKDVTDVTQEPSSLIVAWLGHWSHIPVTLPWHCVWRWLI